MSDTHCDKHRVRWFDYSPVEGHQDLRCIVCEIEQRADAEQGRTAWQIRAERAEAQLSVSDRYHHAAWQLNRLANVNATAHGWNDDPRGPVRLWFVRDSDREPWTWLRGDKSPEGWAQVFAYFGDELPR